MSKLNINKKFFYLVLIFIAILTSFFFFRYSWVSNRKFDRALSYTPPEIQNSIINKLKEHNVPYKIDKKGFIRLSSEYDDLIGKIEIEVRDIYYPDLPNYYISNIGQRDYFINLLKNSNIPYSIKKLDSMGNEYIVWEWEYDKQVQKLIMDFYKKIGITKNLPTLSFPTKLEEDIFIDLLIKENIPFRVVSKSAKERKTIEYNWKHRSEVRNIVEKMYVIMRKEGLYPPEG